MPQFLPTSLGLPGLPGERSPPPLPPAQPTALPLFPCTDTVVSCKKIGAPSTYCVRTNPVGQTVTPWQESAMQSEYQYASQLFFGLADGIQGHCALLLTLTVFWLLYDAAHVNFGVAHLAQGHQMCS